MSRYWNGPDTSFGSVVAIDGLYKGGQYKKEMDHRARIRKTKVTEREYVLRQKKDNEQLISQYSSVWGELVKKEADWWLFTLNHARSVSLVMVDYRGKRMWGTRCDDKMCYWDDVWELKTWRLGENDAFTKDWCISGYHDQWSESEIDTEYEEDDFTFICVYSA